MAAFNPNVALALLDERDALNERLAELEADLAGLAEDHQKATESIKQADAAVKLAHEKFSALAAENAMLKQRTQQLIDIISNTDNDYCMCGSAMKDHVHSGCGYPTGMFDYYYNQWLESDNKTPATDAFLAEVLAHGVEMAACALDDVTQFNYANMLDDLAQKLRKDSNTADPLAAGIITEVGD
ncbi:TPA: ead/Ea22-like family protein [Escherichia coli]|nr:ead/Ea22-like family protein [Escherichia coli]